MEDKDKEQEKCVPTECGEGCSCGCEPEDDEDAEIITLEFDDGESIECEVMGVFEFEEKEYIALIPTDGSDDVFIYGYKEINDDEFELIDIEDDAEFQRVVEEFEKMTVEEE
jgi:uncharacterized protein YrzB (UPF0473 family)